MEKVHWISQDNPIGLACNIEAIGPMCSTSITNVTCPACRDTYEAQNRAAAVVRGSLNHVIEERLARLARTEEKLEQAEKALVANGFTEVARGLWKPLVNRAAAKLIELGFRTVDGVWVPPPQTSFEWYEERETIIGRLKIAETTLKIAEATLNKNGFRWNTKGLWEPPVNKSATHLYELLDALDGVVRGCREELLRDK